MWDVGREEQEEQETGGNAAEKLLKERANWEEQRARCASVSARIRRQRQHSNTMYRILIR